MKNTEKFVYIDPSKIQNFTTHVHYNVKDPFCKTEAGDWDLNISPIDNSTGYVTIIYKSLKDMFVDGKSWQDTDLYEYIKKPIVSGSGDYKWSCKNMERLEKRGESLKQLYESIKQQGVLKHEIIKTKREIENDEIMIAFDRKGKPLSVQNGNHRLILSKFLNVKSIPVKVYKRHEEWEKTKKDIIDFCSNIWKEKTYQPIPHPDFDELIPIWSSNRYELFKNTTSMKKGATILDIGSLFGYMCHRAELDGYVCTACETDSRYLNIMKTCHAAYDMKFQILNKNFLEIDNVEYDVIFALNIFHHYLKTQNKFEQLVNFLKRCKFKELYIQCHDENEPQMLGSYKNLKSEDFASLICQYTNKRDFNFIGEEAARKIYKIS